MPSPGLWSNIPINPFCRRKGPLQSGPSFISKVRARAVQPSAQAAFVLLMYGSLPKTASTTTRGIVSKELRRLETLPNRGFQARQPRDSRRFPTRREPRPRFVSMVCAEGVSCRFVWRRARLSQDLPVARQRNISIRCATMGADFKPLYTDN